MTDDQEIAHQNIRVQQWIALLAFVLFGIKLAAYLLTHSLAIYTDMMEGIVNIIAGLFGLYSLRLSAQPRDKKHPYGHGKVEFISAFLEGGMIVCAGIVIIGKIISRLHDPAEIHSLDLGIGLIALTAMVNYTFGFLAVKKGNANNSLALVASGKHLQSDTYTTFGVIAGLVAVKLTGYLLIDKLVALVFAGWIIYEGALIIRQAFGGMMDEADMPLIEELVAYLNEHRRENWLDLHNLRVIKYGRILHIDAHLMVPWHLNVREAHAELRAIEQVVQAKYGQNVEMFVHLDPSPDSYTIENQSKNPWTVQHAILRHPHKSS